MALTLDGQVSVNGLLMGPGTSYDVEQFKPYTRSTRADQSPRPWDHGSWSGREFTEAAAVPLRVHLVADNDAGWLVLQQQLAAALRPADEDVELRWRIAGGEYLMHVRPRLVDPDPGWSGYGHGPASCALMALDPRIYSATQEQQVLALPSTSGGLTAPFTAPFTVAATVTAGTAQLTNTGTADTGLLLRIDAGGAQLVEPRVSLRVGTTVSVLRCGLTLEAGQWLMLDTAAKTAYLNDTVSRRGTVSGPWPLLPAGTSELSFAAGAYSAAAQLTATWRSAWT